MNQKQVHPALARQREQLVKDKLLAKIDALATKADKLEASDPLRAEIVDRIAKLNANFQAKD